MKMKKIKMRAVKMAHTQNQNEMINVVKLCCQFGAFVDILQFMFVGIENFLFFQFFIYYCLNLLNGRSLCPKQSTASLFLYSFNNIRKVLD